MRFQIRPFTVPAIPPAGEHPPVGVVRTPGPRMNNSFTWWPGCAQKGGDPSSRRATKLNFAILWREVSTGGANLRHHPGDAETATPYYETFVVFSPPTPLPSQVIPRSYHLGLGQVNATKNTLSKVWKSGLFVPLCPVTCSILGAPIKHWLCDHIRPNVGPQVSI